MYRAATLVLGSSPFAATSSATAMASWSVEAARPPAIGRGRFDGLGSWIGSRRG